MTSQLNTIKSIFIITLLYISSSNTNILAGEHILIPKIGTVSWSENTNHKIQNNSFDFEDETVESFGFTYLYEYDNGFAVGADVFSYGKDIVTTENNNGDANISHIYGVAEKFFNNDSAFRPYIGVGLGFASIKFDANINGNIADDYDDYASYLSYEIYTGIEFQFNNSVGLMLEYKYFNLDINDDINGRNVNLKSNGDAFFVGISIHL